MPVAKSEALIFVSQCHMSKRCDTCVPMHQYIADFSQTHMYPLAAFMRAAVQCLPRPLILCTSTLGKMERMGGDVWLAMGIVVRDGSEDRPDQLPGWGPPGNQTKILWRMHEVGGILSMNENGWVSKVWVLLLGNSSNLYHVKMWEGKNNFQEIWPFDTQLTSACGVVSSGSRSWPTRVRQSGRGRANAPHLPKRRAHPRVGGLGS